MTSSLIDRLNAVSEQVALKRPVRVTSTVNLVLSGFQAIDGVTPAASDQNLRVLVKNQATASENGIYLMASGAWERTADFDGNRDVVRGTRVPVTEGDVGANKTYVVTSADPIVIDTTGITFSEITESLVTTEFSKPRAPFRAVFSSATLFVSDAGKQIDVDCTGGDVVVTLPKAEDLTDGDRVTIRYAAGINQTIIVCQGSDAINGAASMALTSRYESLTLSTNGAANWSIIGHAKPFAMGGVVFIKVVSRTLLTPPVSPEPGARYIIAASGTPIGDWSSHANNDVVESNGQGGWIRYTPSESWHAYVEAENKLVFFTGAGWQGLPNTDDPGASNLRTMVLQDAKTTGTSGGQATSGSWQKRTLNTERVNTIPGASLASSQITLPTGRYRFYGNQTFLQTNSTRIRAISTTSPAKKITSTNIILSSGNADRGLVSLFGELEVTAGTEVFEFQYYVSNGPANSLGEAHGFEEEIYATLVIEDLESLEGRAGDQGEQGPQGFAGFKFTYDGASTTVPAAPSGPGSGKIRFNSLTLSAISAASVSRLSAETGTPDVSDEIAAWDDMGILKMAKVGAEQNWVTFDVTNVVDNGDYLDLTLVHRDDAGSFSDTNSVSLQFAPKGETGVTGSSVLALDYRWNTDLSGGTPDPTSGHLSGDSGTLSAITQINIHRFDRLGVNVEALIAAFDESGAPSPGIRGHFYIIDFTTQTNRAVYKVIDSVADAGDYSTFAVQHVMSNGAFADDVRVALLFVPAGITGTLGGTLGLVDSVIPKSSGTGGVTLQPSSLTESSAGKLTVNLASTAANAVSAGAKVSHTTTGTPSSGIGVAIELEVEGAGGNVVSGRIDSVLSTVTSSTEDADMVFRTMSGGALTERMRIKDDGTIQLGSTAALALKSAGGQNLTGGFTTTPYSIGTISGGIVTPDGANGQQQYLTNNGAFQINPPTADTAIDILITNSGSAGTITFSSGFTVGTSVGDSLPTANGSKGLVSIRRINSISTYIIKSLSTST